MWQKWQKFEGVMSYYCPLEEQNFGWGFHVLLLLIYLLRTVPGLGGEASSNVNYVNDFLSLIYQNYKKIKLSGIAICRTNTLRQSCKRKKLFFKEGPRKFKLSKICGVFSEFVLPIHNSYRPNCLICSQKWALIYNCLSDMS